MSSAALMGRTAAPDAMLALLGAALLLTGLVAIGSASIEYGDWHHGDPWYHTRRHLIFLGLGLVAALGVYRIELAFWENTGWVWLFAALALLILVLIPGSGSR